MTATHKPFKIVNLAYTEVYNYLRNSTSAISPTTIKELHDKCPNTKSRIQVSDALKKFRAAGVVASIREGMELKFWWAKNTGRDSMDSTMDTPIPKLTQIVSAVKEVVVEKPAILTTKPQQQVQTLVTVPEILLTKEHIIINTSGVKITIERQ